MLTCFGKYLHGVFPFTSFSVLEVTHWCLCSQAMSGDFAACWPIPPVIRLTVVAHSA